MIPLDPIGYSVNHKALMPVRSKALLPDELDAFMDGKVPWRILAIPFGGPIPSRVAPKGADLDGQWFSERTDIYAGYSALRTSNERIVDWHHSLYPAQSRDGGDPRKLMNGVALGKAMLDPEPDEEGHWVDFWAAKGQERLSLVKRLIERGVQLFGSAHPIVAGKADRETGEILTFPYILQTITTHPQNTLSVVRPKAALHALDSAEISVSPALRTLLTELDDLGAELPRSFPSGGDVAVKADGVLSALGAANDALGDWEVLRDRLRSS